MRQTTANTNTQQLRMPGIAASRRRPPAVVTCCSVAPGQAVIYTGKISGGPSFGSTGVVTQARQRKAVVDMGTSGVWNIPYYFLTTPQAA